MIKIITNSDKDFVKEIRDKIKANNGYCPCSLIKNEDTKCMCKEFKQQVKDGIIGECHCGLYLAIEE